MPPQKKDIPISFPVFGLDQGQSESKQPEGTTIDCKNVLAFDASARRQRGGRRPGLSQRTMYALGGKIQLLDTIVPAAVSGATEAISATSAYLYGPDVGSRGDGSAWINTEFELPENTSISYRDDFPRCVESSELAPKTDSDGNWAMGAYGTALANKDIPLLPNGTRIRTNDGGVWTKRVWSDKTVITPCPPIPYVNPERPRGDRHQNYYRIFREGVETLTGASLTNKPLYYSHLPRMGLPIDERTNVENIYFGGGNNKKVGDPDARATDKMSFSSVFFPYADGDNEPFNSKSDKDFICSCSIRPAPWDNLKPYRTTGSSHWNYKISHLVDGIRDGETYDNTHHESGAYRIWDKGANAWADISSTDTSYFIPSINFYDPLSGDVSYSQYYY